MIMAISYQGSETREIVCSARSNWQNAYEVNFLAESSVKAYEVSFRMESLAYAYEESFATQSSKGRENR
ncbi:hypothetical protein GCM10008018_66840 [Paenibacillus marchantiophytorum]|uniref:Uncharacterized protein n=1 Tax=Paenibacillus marchantiophytorum TaxID=1619310 RepID=A0ABQ1FIF5_9BACL|nr:hypothetical protein GCM10008018_66840 [Paenibacillus marchantiophytorum]